MRDLAHGPEQGVVVHRLVQKSKRVRASERKSLRERLGNLAAAA
ncbi:hypothetical protein [Dankookia rubra]|nr:hypothetical protein [Dankookia rubra]